MNKTLKVLVCLLSPLALMSCQCQKKSFYIDSVRVDYKDASDSDKDTYDVKKPGEEATKKRVPVTYTKICYKDGNSTKCKELLDNINDVNGYLNGTKTETEGFVESK